MIVSPKWDYCMKELFRNPVILKNFLSAALEIPLEEIKSVMDVSAKYSRG